MIPGVIAGGHARNSAVELRVQDASFSALATVTIKDLQPSALLDFSDSFDAVNFTSYPIGSAPMTPSVSGGKLHVGSATNGDKNLLVVEGSALIMPQAFYSIDVDSHPKSGGYNVIGIGAVKDANNWMFVEYDSPNNELRLEYRFNGSGSFVGGISLNISGPYALAISFVGNSVVAYTKTAADADWVVRIVQANPFDLKTRDLQNYKPGLIFATNAAIDNVLDNWKAGRFGSYGIRDVTVVTDEAGNPVVSGNRVHATATLNDPTGVSYCGVVEVDLSSYAVEIVGTIMVDRGGARQNDVAAHLIHYPDNSSRLCISSWGNGFGGSIQILHKLDAADLRTGAHLVAGMTQLVMPNVLDGDDGAYDPYLVRQGAGWALAYSFTERTDFAGSPFYPCLATSIDLATWALVGAPSADRPYEGTKILRYQDGTYAVLAGGPSAYRAYDSTMAFVGNISAPIDGQGVTQPHPMVFGDGIYFYMLTFNGTKPAGISAAFTWGQLVICRAARY